MKNLQKLINGTWVPCAESGLVSGDDYRFEVGNGGWQQQQYIPVAAPIDITITGIVGAISHSDDFSAASIYEGDTMTITGAMAVPDRSFALPIRRNDDRLFIFMANVVGGIATINVNFPTSGAFICSNNEVNKDFDSNVFNIKPIHIDVFRKVL